VLHRIYQKLFEADVYSPWSLTKAVRQIETLRRVSKNWSQALINRPPALCLKIDEYECCHAKWISAFPVKTLHLHLFVPRIDDEQDEEDIREPRPVLVTDCVHGSMEGLSFGKMNALEHLNIECRGFSWDNGDGIFNADPLQNLKHLKHLQLEGFLEYELKNLPLSVRNITLSYGEPDEDEVNDEMQFSLIPELPKNISLDRLAVFSYSAIGLANLDTLWNCCKAIELDAEYCLLGVPVLDQEVITAFERPYREGRYVPPHILADPDAQEASSKASEKTMEYLLSGVASSLKLEVLSFWGTISSSGITLVPGNLGYLRFSVEFLHSVVKHRLKYLPVVDGWELRDRLDIMEETKTLPASAVKLDLHEDECFYDEFGSKDNFRVIVESRAFSGKMRL